MPDVTIQRLTTADAAAYRTMRLLTLKTEPAFFGLLYEDEVDKPLEAFATILATETVLAAFDADTLVGVVRLRARPGRKERHKCSLHGVFVHPDHCGRGIGSAMVSAAMDAARPHYARMTLNVVAGNGAAIAMYQRLGFVTFGIEPCARRYEGVDSDMVSMSVDLARAGAA